MGLKKRYFYIFVVVVFFVFLEAQNSAYAQNVVVLFGSKSEAVSLALKGFKDVYREGSLKEYNLQRAIALTVDYTALQKIKSSLNFADLILVIGEDAAQFVKGLNIPIVFILVRKYEKYGLGRGDTCGVSMTPSAWNQLNTLKKVAPDVKRIGVIYDPKESKEIIDEAKKEAPALGLEIVALEVESKGEIAEAIRVLKGKIDAFWMIDDPLVANNAVLRRLLLVTLTYKIPLVVPTASMVEKGALLSVGPSYEAIGRKAGELVAQRISGKPAEEIGVQSPGIEFTLNLKIARKLGLSIPQTIINQAARVYE